MSREGIRKLLGGYATGTLTAEEQQALFEAALDDQELFDALARDQSLRDLLRDPAARAQLLAALDDAPDPWHQRLGRWMWGHAVGLAAVACFLVVGGYVVRIAKFTPERIRLIATQPTTVEVNGSAESSAKPRRVFDLKSAQKAAPPVALELPPPPVIAQRLPVTRLPLAPHAPQIPPPATPLAGPMAAAGGRGGAGGGVGGGVGGFGGGRQSFQAAVIGGLGAGRFGPNTDSVAEMRVMATGALAGTTTDSSGADVPGAQVSIRNLVTGATRSTVTTPEGIFRFNGLEPSRYSVTIAAQGFAKNDIASVDVTPSAVNDVGRIALKVGTISTDVAVTAAATPVNTTASENSKLVDAGQIADLTLKGRDLFAVLTTVPGVYFGNAYLTGGDAASESTALQNMQINGGAAGKANFQVDGITNLDTGSNQTTHFEPTMDSIAEARVSAAAAARVPAGKLDPALVALAQRVRSGGKPTADESRFVSQGAAYVRLTLTNASADTLGQLKSAGFTITGQKGNEIAGHIPVEKLAALAQFPFVVRIAPR